MRSATVFYVLFYLTILIALVLPSTGRVLWLERELSNFLNINFASRLLIAVGGNGAVPAPTDTLTNVKLLRHDGVLAGCDTAASRALCLNACEDFMTFVPEEYENCSLISRNYNCNTNCLELEEVYAAQICMRRSNEVSTRDGGRTYFRILLTNSFACPAA